MKPLRVGHSVTHTKYTEKEHEDTDSRTVRRQSLFSLSYIVWVTDCPTDSVFVWVTDCPTVSVFV